MSDNQSAVRLESVRKEFGVFVAVKSVDLDIEDGSFVTLLGPSGCGKTTLLRMVAGLEAPTAGDIVIKGKRVNEVPIHKRNLGLVFQNYALFPHKNVFDNIGFGLKYRGVNKDEIARRVKATLDIVRLPGVEKRLPSQLSGGQQQRIALARAIVIEPHVLLLDEPLSALDANLREQMRSELKNIQREIGVTTIFVTHDQDEALAMSDRVVVMDHGQVEQVGTPQQVYGQPATRFVADFLGQSNILPGAVDSVADGAVTVRLDNGESVRTRVNSSIEQGARVELVVRAHGAEVKGPDAEASDGGNCFKGRIADVSYLGGLATYFVDVSGTTCQAINPIRERMFERDEVVTLHTGAGELTLLDANGRRVP